MDTLFLYNTKTLKEKFNTKVFAGDNHITKINVQIPDNIGGYPKRECEYNLRAIIPEGNLSYMIDPSQPYFYITNDITEKAQTVKLMMIITHEGNVIGRTNTVDLVVNEPAEAPDPPLTPRDEFDDVIAEQRAEIAEQAETISTQGETITQQTERITELNEEVMEKDGQITELTTENTRLENLTDTQRETIQNMLDNQPQPKLYTPDMIIPEEETRQYTPRPGYDGFSSFTVKGTIIPDGTIRITENDVDVDVSRYSVAEIRYLDAPFAGILDRTWKGKLKVPYGCNQIGRSAFDSCSSITEIFLPNTIKFLQYQGFFNCSELETINIPNSMQSISSYNPFTGCGRLKNVIIENGFNCFNLNLSSSTRYSVETIVSWLEALADRTGETAYTLTIGTTNINKLTAEQRAIATNKNWNLA